MSLAQENLAFLPSRRALLSPERIALTDGDRRFSYAALEERAARCAGALVTLGVGPGDRVAWLLGSSVEAVDLMLACARIAAVAVPLDPALAPEVAGRTLGDAGARVLVHDARLDGLAEEAAGAAGVGHLLTAGEAGEGSYADALAAAPLAAAPARVRPEELAGIFYFPAAEAPEIGEPERPARRLGVMFTHGSIAWAALDAVLTLGAGTAGVGRSAIPLWRPAGWTLAALPVWWRGGRLDLAGDGPAGAAIPAGAAEMRPAGAAEAPGGGASETRAEADASGTRSETVLVCEGPVPSPAGSRSATRGVAAVGTYCPEGVAGLCLVRDAGAEARPSLLSEVRVAGTDGRPLGPGGSGEVIVRGPALMRGFWRDAAATAEALRGGWLWTGERGTAGTGGRITPAGPAV